MQFALLLAAQVSSALLQAVAVLVLARWLAPSEFGAFAGALASLAVVVTLSDFGLATLALRRRAQDIGDASVSTLIRWAMVLTTVVGAIATLVVIVVAARWIGVLGAGLIGMYSIADRLLQICLGIPIADKRPGVNVVALLFARSVLVAGVVIGVVALGMAPVVAYGLGGTLGGALAALGVWKWLSMPTRLRSMSLGGDLRAARPFWIASGSALVRTLDVTVLAFVAGPTVAGVYAVPSRVSAPIRILPLTLNKMAIPYAASSDRSALLGLTRVMRALTVLMVLFATCVWIFASEIIILLVGAGYMDATWPLRIILVGVVINVSGSFKSGLIQGLGHEKFIAKLGVMLAVLCLILVALLGAFIGAIGAAVGVSVVFAIQWIVVTMKYRTLEPRSAATNG